MKRILAPLNILISNLLLCIASFLLKKFTIVYAVPVLILFGSNLLASYPFFLEPRQHLTEAKPFFVLIFFWSLIYCFTYFVFAHFNQYLYVPHLMLAQAQAPFVVLFFKQSWRRDALKKENLVEIILPSLFLFLLLYSLNGYDSFSWIKYALTTVLMLAFIASQYCYRAVSTGTPSVFQVMHTLVCSIMFLPFLLTESINAHTNLLYLAGGIVVIGVCIILVQRGMLYGINHTTPLFSALLISTAIPISFITEFLMNSKSGVTYWQLVMSALYCVVIFVVHYRKGEALNIK